MLAKQNRISRVVFTEYSRKTKVFQETSFVARAHFLKNGSKSRFSVVVPKSVWKTSVDRHSIKRFIYLAIKQHLAVFPVGYYFFFIQKKASKEVYYAEFTHFLEVLTQKSY